MYAILDGKQAALVGVVPLVRGEKPTKMRNSPEHDQAVEDLMGRTPDVEPSWLPRLGEAAL